MKIFEGKHYYEILKLPFHATSMDIKQGYLEALDMYEENALVTYALFSDEQRKELLRVIDEAYRTLSDEHMRVAYNEMLINTGQVAPDEFPMNVKSAAVTCSNDLQITQNRDLKQWVAQKSKESKVRLLIEAITTKSLVSGADLKELREAMQIEMSDIFEVTRISKTTLEMIEQNRYADLPAEIYLKSFLRSYAQILQIDADRIVESYLKHKAFSV